MSTKEKMHEIASDINEKAKKYAPIVKEKLVSAYQKTKDFTVNVIVPKLKAGSEHLKEKIEDWQKNKQAAKENAKANTLQNKTSTTTTTTTTNTVPPTNHTQAQHTQSQTQTEHKKHQNHL